MVETISFKTSSPSGDLISYLPGIREIYRETGKKSIIYQRIGMVGVGHEGSIHPFSNEFGESVCMPEVMFNMLRPLLLAQEYIEDFIIYSGQGIDMDMDKIRLEVFTNQPKGNLRNWPEYAFPQMAHDLSEKSLFLPEAENKYKGRIVCNFTQRYRNFTTTYFFLKEHERELLFAGLSEERDLFCKQWNLDIELLVVNDFLELAKVIEECRFFVGCQSFCFQIAESLKVPRILEVFPLMPNVIPIGKYAYQFYHQGHLEFNFNKLLNLELKES